MNKGNKKSKAKADLSISYDHYAKISDLEKSAKRKTIPIESVVTHNPKVPNLRKAKFPLP